MKEERVAGDIARRNVEGEQKNRMEGQKKKLLFESGSSSSDQERADSSAGSKATSKSSTVDNAAMRCVSSSSLDASNSALTSTSVASSRADLAVPEAGKSRDLPDETIFYGSLSSDDLRQNMIGDLIMAPRQMNVRQH